MKPLKFALETFESESHAAILKFLTDTGCITPEGVNETRAGNIKTAIEKMKDWQERKEAKERMLLSFLIPSVGYTTYILLQSFVSQEEAQPSLRSGLSHRSLEKKAVAKKFLARGKTLRTDLSVEEQRLLEQWLALIINHKKHSTVYQQGVTALKQACQHYSFEQIAAAIATYHYLLTDKRSWLCLNITRPGVKATLPEFFNGFSDVVKRLILEKGGNKAETVECWFLECMKPDVLTQWAMGVKRSKESIYATRYLADLITQVFGRRLDIKEGYEVSKIAAQCTDVINQNRHLLIKNPSPVECAQWIFDAVKIADMNPQLPLSAKPWFWKDLMPKYLVENIGFFTEKEVDFASLQHQNFLKQQQARKAKNNQQEH